MIAPRFGVLSKSGLTTTAVLIVLLGVGSWAFKRKHAYA